MKKAFHLFLTFWLTVLAYALYVPIAALYIASWPFRIVGWLLKSAAETGTALQNKADHWARLQTAFAYGFKTVPEYDAHCAAEAAERKAAVNKLKAEFEAHAAAAFGAVSSAT